MAFRPKSKPLTKPKRPSEAENFLDISGIGPFSGTRIMKSKRVREPKLAQPSQESVNRTIKKALGGKFR